jgi:hypothetical protein
MKLLALERCEVLDVLGYEAIQGGGKPEQAKATTR